jgi:hypothetical protein
LKAGAILERIAAQQPNHPGIAHYLIHSYDYTPLAARALPYADKYAMIAPAAPHALHMPSHTYSMLGMSDKSMVSNQAALAVARDFAAKNWPGASDPTQLHSLDFMEYAYLQMGQDTKAKAIVDEVNATRKLGREHIVAYTAMAAIPAHYALERGDWKAAAALEPRGSQFAAAESITYFARALGAARSGDPAAAARDIEKLNQLKATLTHENQAYWAEQTEVQILAASGWSSFAQGRRDEAIRMMRAAADLEDRSEKHVAMENRLYPMRELLGDMLMEANKPNDALVEYQASLRATPRRLRGFFSAARAAEMAKQGELAASYYRQLEELTSNSDSSRPEVRLARLRTVSR